LADRLAHGDAAAARETAGDVDADPALTDGTWARFELGARLRNEARVAAGAQRWSAAADLYRRATEVRPDDHLAWRGLADAAEHGRDDATARAAWERVLSLAPEGPAAERDARARLAALEHR
jgi:tetratricopeptide (TPR) repeat protein